MEGKYLVDTNSIIDYLDNRLPDNGAEFLNGIQINMSVITRMELLSWPRAAPNQLKILEDFIKQSIIFNLDESIIIMGIEIRRQYRVKLPDAIIAATAHVLNFTLLTHNTSDFKNIPGLDLLNPWDL